MSRQRPRLLVVFYANPDNYPPTFNAVTLLAQHFDVRVVCRKTDRESRLYPRGVQLDRIGWSRGAEDTKRASAAEKARELAAFTWAVRRRLSEDGPDVVLAYEPHAFTAVRLAGCRAPIVYQRHEVEDLQGFDRKSLGGWVGRYALRHSADAALMIFPEARRAAYYQEHVSLPRAPLVIPNYPLLASFPRPAFEAVLPARARARHVFYRGSLGAGNGILEAVRTLALLPPELPLRLCGPASPEFARELEAVATTCGVRDRIDLPGFVPFDELNRQTLEASVGLMLYQAVDTNWSNIATANNKLWEYAACGVPSLAPRRRAFEELLSDETWVTLVDEQSPREISAAIVAMLADRGAYDEKARAARRAFEERFNYEVVFGPMLSAIRELAGAQAR